jgi:serine/threonine-protein kinase
VLEAGDKVDRYVVEKLLGEGGMGSVYLARDTQLGRKIALKIMRADSRAGTEGSARILREARAAAALVHPNAVAVFDAREVDGVTYLAMEYLEGRPLREAMLDTSVTAATRVRWLGDIARALAAAHACGLVHRDIKPENVMIKPDGTVKVLDFGIARQVSAIDPNGATAPSVSASTLSGTGLMVGTPHYMAPEQMRGDDVDGRADQFAWGVTAYEVLTGKLPWANPHDGVKLIAEVVSASPVASLAGRAPAEVASVVDRALSKDPRDRFSTMDDVVAALDGLATSETRVMPSAAAARTGSRSGMIPLVLGGVVLAAVAMGLLALRGDKGGSPVPAPSAATSASVKLTDLPVPESRVPEATLHYKKGLQDLHDASIARGHAALGEATTGDPSLAAAWLREAVWVGVPKSRARAAFLSAQQLRASLSERDRAVLHAYEPLHAGDPADPTAAYARLMAVAARYPGDAEIALLAGWSASALGKNDEAATLFERSLAIDPTFAAAEFGLSGVRTGDPARAALSRCVELSPTAASCLRALAFREAERGDCAAYESVAGRSLSVDPDGETAQIMMLGGLMSHGRPRAAMEPIVERLRASGQDVQMRAAVAAHFGDFGAAIATLKIALDEATRAHSDRRRAFASVLLLQLTEETGDDLVTVPLVRAYLGERATWDPDVPELDGMSLGVMARGKGVPEAERASSRAQLFETLGKKAGGPDAQVTFLVEAAAARTPDEARRAVAALGGKTLDDHLEPVRSAAVGRALLLAGRPDDAIRHLEAAARNCAVLGQWSPAVVSRVWARADLAEARAQKGDVAGACAALSEVTAQWGDAKPRSLTATRAAQRSKALSCPR